MDSLDDALLETEEKMTKCQDHLRTQSNDSLDARMQRVANLRHQGRCWRVIAVTGVTDEAIARADCVNNLSQIRRQRNDPLDAGGNGDSLACLVGHCARLWRIYRRNLCTAREAQRQDVSQQECGTATR